MFCMLTSSQKYTESALNDDTNQMISVQLDKKIWLTKQKVQVKSVRPLSCCYISSGFFRVRWDQRERNLSSHLDPTEISVKCKDSSILEKQRPSWPDARFCQWGSFHWVIPSMSVTSWYSIIQTNVCITAVFTVKLLRVLKPTLLSIWHCVCVCVCACWVYPTWDCALTLAPLLTSSLTTSVWPASEAMCRAVFPF